MYAYSDFLKGIGFFLCALVGFYFLFFWVGRAVSYEDAISQTHMDQCVATGQDYLICQATIYGN